MPNMLNAKGFVIPKRKKRFFSTIANLEMVLNRKFDHS